MKESITDLGWPPKSPDLNLIENAWGELTRRLYARGRQFNTTEDLYEALFYEWEKLDIDYIRKLIRSFPRRLVDGSMLVVDTLDIKVYVTSRCTSSTSK